ncbi:DUF5937 family protein [Paractinoplanes rishiriensis]|uniref:Transcriptional regulator n=1 Tax=Paractinoplanes rishiriensis TaxID=1050105 RepID=A0A919JT52_9ACTN|nr:DUF5937 family protein [Actinoplanes rishiriensis]GIE92999.1 transcriptional regulator [Actinoplanes rishiriensis]
MLRIHFTPQDLGRVRMAGEPDPMWETVLSVFRLRRPGPRLIFGRWREHALRASRRSDLDMLLPLVQPRYYPDFLTPAEASQGLSHALEALMSTPAARLRAELTELARLGEPMPSWLRGLADGDTETLVRLTAAIRSHYEAVVEPFWPQARAHIEADRARRSRIMLDRGAEGLLDSFRPMMRWSPPVLEVDVVFEQTIHLDGRGLLLVPSYLSWDTPDMLHDPALPPVLVYPLEHDLSLGPRACPGGSMEALIGRTAPRCWSRSATAAPRPNWPGGSG